ncbi:MAG: transcriptional repressor [Nitrospirae bacterium]|nr:transcriptional repressor [Nitrospirota bacterium]
MKNFKKNDISNPHVSGKKERLRAFIKKMGFKATRQRDLIATEFLKTAGHITAEDLYKKISRRHKEIGFTTVYRTLKLLSKSGLATERVFADNLTRYEPVSAGEHHDHLICMGCGGITEFEDIQIEKLQDAIASELGFTIITHKMEIYGYCKECKAGHADGGIEDKNARA